MRIFRILRQDKLLLVFTAVLWACACIPLFVTPFLPFKDMPYNAASAGLLWPTAFGDPFISHYFKINSAFVPYWTMYIVFTVLNRFVGTLLAAKIIVALLVGFLPLSMMRLLVALERNPRLGLWAFLLTWDHNLYWGWTTFQTGMILAVFAVAALIEAKTFKEMMLRVFPLSILVGFSHVHAIAFLGVCAIFLAFVERPFIRRFFAHGFATCGAGITLIGWFIQAVGPSIARKQPGRAAVFEWHGLDIKASRLFQYTLDNIPDTKATAAAFLILLLGPLLLASAKRSAAGLNDKKTYKEAFCILLAALVLYLSLPMAVQEPVVHWYTYPRYATYILLSMLLLPKPRLNGARFLLLAPGIVSAVFLDMAIARQFALFGKHAAPFLEVVAHIKPHSKVLPLVSEGNDPSMKIFPPFGGFHCYVAPLTNSFTPYLWDHIGMPLLYRPENRLPRPVQKAQVDFSIKKHAQYYDYILIQGKSGDPIAKKPKEEGIRFHVIAEGGMFRLYSVEISDP